VLALRRFIRRNGPDVILANGGATLRYLVMARLLSRPRPALAYASIGEPAYWVRGPLHRLMQRVLLAQCARILAVSEATARQLEEVLKVSPEKIVVAPTGIPDEFFQIERRPRGDGETHVLVLGNLSEEKDPLAALEIAVTAQEQTPLRIRFVGEGPLRPSLRASAAASVIADRFESVGQVDDVKPHLGWADVLLLTSRTEGLPGAVLEASAAKVPTVAFSVGGVGEAVEDGITGFLIKGRSRDEAAAKIRYLADNPEIRESMGEAGRKRVYRDFSLDRAVDLYSRVLIDLTRKQVS
jgi:glycosyltransferase involved in cell wall biosynthesis